MKPSQPYTVHRSDDQWTLTKVTALTEESANPRQIRWLYAELAWAIVCFATYIGICVLSFMGNPYADGAFWAVIGYYLCNKIDRKLLAKASPPATKP